jgi:hypothetical protein
MQKIRPVLLYRRTAAMAGLIRLSVFALLVVLLPDLAASDVIVLKDGTKVKAPKPVKNSQGTLLNKWNRKRTQMKF